MSCLRERGRVRGVGLRVSSEEISFSVGLEIVALHFPSLKERQFCLTPQTTVGDVQFVVGVIKTRE